jgi:hypothetical protein
MSDTKCFAASHNSLTMKQSFYQPCPPKIEDAKMKDGRERVGDAGRNREAPTDHIQKDQEFGIFGWAHLHFWDMVLDNHLPLISLCRALQPAHGGVSIEGWALSLGVQGVMAGNTHSCPLFQRISKFMRTNVLLPSKRLTPNVSENPFVISVYCLLRKLSYFMDQFHVEQGIYVNSHLPPQTSQYSTTPMYMYTV